jgi:predicted transcriptional regulator
MSTEKEMTTVTIALPSAQKKKWQKLAEEREQSLSGFVRRGMEAYIYALRVRRKKLGNVTKR